jgi:hypothetical protein
VRYRSRNGSKEPFDATKEFHIGSKVATMLATVCSRVISIFARAASIIRARENIGL